MEADQHAGAPERRRRTAIGLGLEHRAHCEAGNLTPAVKNRELLFRRSNKRLAAVRIRSLRHFPDRRALGPVLLAKGEHAAAGMKDANSRKLPILAFKPAKIAKSAHSAVLRPFSALSTAARASRD
jgi:hypothetical protein